MNKPLISIIVPIYNVETYLDRCIQSLLNQTLKNIEIILVDDESPDNCPQKCEQYAALDHRIKIIHKKNEGLGFARNSGMELASGEFIAFIDSDDYVDLDMFENLYSIAICKNADAVYSNFYIEQNSGKWVNSNEVNQPTEWINNNIKEFMLDMIASAPYVKQERKYQMSVWHSIYRRSIIKKHQIKFLSEREVGSEDIPFQIDFLLKSQKILYIPKAFYHYCNNGKSLTSTYKFQMFNLYKNLFNILSNKTKDIPTAQQRLDRFFIGYSRYCIIHLALINNRSAKSNLKDLIKDPIWNKIFSRYKCSFLPLYQRLFYWLTIKKQIFILILLSKLQYKIKQILNYRNN